MAEKVNLKDKVVCYVDSGLFVEQAIKVAKDFKKVYYFSEWRMGGFPSKKGVTVGEGFDEIVRVNDIWEIVDEVDLWVFPDCYYGGEQEHLRSLGKKVFGGGYGDELELDRNAAKKFFKSVGLPVQSYKVIIGLDKLRDHLKTVKNKWIKISAFRGDGETWHHEKYSLSEPMLDEMEAKLGVMQNEYEFIVEDSIDGDDVVEAGSDLYTIDGQYPKNIISGFEIKDLGYVGCVNEYSKLSKLVTGFNDKVASALKNFKYRGFMSTEIRVGKDKIPYMIDFCGRCFSSDTEVLTEKGWMLISEWDGETVATLNTKNKQIEYQRPTHKIIRHYDGEMMLLSNKAKTIECLITPDHDVLVMRESKNKYLKIQAKDLTGELYIPRTGEWNPSISDDYFILPSYSKISRTNKIHRCEVKIPMSLWAEFLGWYLSEGSINKSVITIYQLKYRDEIETLLNQLPFKYSKTKDAFVICNSQLSSYLKTLGVRCFSKEIPKYILTSKKEIMNLFFNSYLLGDGHIKKGNGNYRIVTTSNKIADQLQEIVFKLGGVARIYKKFPNSKYSKVLNGKLCESKLNSFNIEVSFCRPEYKLIASGKRKNEFISNVKYNGKAYCLTVDNGTLYVRRNGKPFWSGNCGSPPNELYMEMITNTAEIMWYGSQGIMIEPKYEAKCGIECLIHSDWADKNWQAIYFPEKIRRWVKLRNACKLNGTYYIVPQANGLPEIGAVVAIGDTIEECIKKVKEYADQVEGYRLDIKTGSIENMKEVMEKAEKLGIKIN